MVARDANREASELLTGALRKVAITQYHARELVRVLDEVSPYEIALQAHFEGLVFAGISAEEKLAIALAMLAGTGTDKDTKLLFRRLLDRVETSELGAEIRSWVGHREYQIPVPNRDPVASRENGPVPSRWKKPLKCRQFLGNGAAQESNLPSVGLPRLTGFEDRVGHRARAAPRARVPATAGQRQFRERAGATALRPRRRARIGRRRRRRGEPSPPAGRLPPRRPARGP
jgi:hypothetical protein